MYIRKALPQLGFLRPMADDDLAARQVKRQELFQIFLDGNAADADEDRAWQIERNSQFRPEPDRIDAARAAIVLIIHRSQFPRTVHDRVS